MKNGLKYRNTLDQKEETASGHSDHLRRMPEPVRRGSHWPKKE